MACPPPLTTDDTEPLYVLSGPELLAIVHEGWYAWDFTAAEIYVWHSAGFGPELASEWTRHHFSPSEACAWDDLSLSPEEAMWYRCRGLGPDDVSRRRRESRDIIT